MTSEESLGELPEEDVHRAEEAEEEGADPVASEGAAGESDDAPEASPHSTRRRTVFALLRAVAVLIVAAVVYQLVVPQSHVDRARLSRLVPTGPGVAKFKVKSPQSGEVAASGTQLNTVISASEKAPNKTGGYTTSWSPSGALGAGVLVFLLPTTAQAEAVLPEVRSQQAAAGTYTSEGLTRHATYTVSGVPGSAGGTYAPTSKTAGGLAGLSITTFRYGRVVAAIEVVEPSTAQADTTTIAANEYDVLRRVEPGFTLTKVTRPIVASSLWIAGAVILAVIAALAPFARRRMAARRQRRIDEELSHMVVVRGQTISKHRR
jgi:hypothetical protein